MSENWQRAYHPGAGRWGVIAWEAAGLTYLHWTTVRLFDLGSAAGWVLAVTFALAWAAGSWQVGKMGLYVSDTGLRLRGVVRTRTVEWVAIEAVTVEEVVERVGPWRVPAGRTIMLTLHDGRRLNTAMWERGLDFHGRADVFRAVYQELRDRIRTPVGVG
ncbi:PH domain-containing protein [Actinoplanes sp. LDG1-06]|uniref:PH domain-containing protein n=1 Tax=Paractinoplanes ovalisporus TaxID=2810368 RepID=A0ABS2A5T4_9ACTN|nr:PH domain-containing protein [Actinoplanes ovalisporus]MBM2615210.1 PH domain-containing protein [Actinoplanes ovalisporus]